MQARKIRGIDVVTAPLLGSEDKLYLTRLAHVLRIGGRPAPDKGAR